MIPIILGSTSIYRQKLLKKSGLAFSTQKPGFDEESVKEKLLTENNKPVEIAEALSRGKALSLRSDSALIIAGDQLVSYEEKILGKPGSFEKALLQLQQLNGKTHELITAVTLQTPTHALHLNHVTKLKMKKLTDVELSNYLKKDQPYDAAGSYKIEESGLILFEKIESDDFSAIEGLPLIWITNQLQRMGYEFFKS